MNNFKRILLENKTITSRILYSDSPNLKFQNAKQTKNSFKPRGLWYSWDEHWVNWLNNKNLNHLKKKYKYEIKVNLNDILIIETLSDFQNFEFSKYWLKTKNRKLNWSLVAKDYSGIELRYPYLRWDIPSGCIWNDNGIKQIIKL